MKLISKILILFFFLACSEEYAINQKNGLHFIKNFQTELEHAKHIDWKIGKKKEAVVSKGLRLFVSVPKIKKKGRELLFRKYGVNSYIFKFSRVRKGRAEAIGFYYLLFDNMTRNTKNISVSLFYQAASVSKGFRNFHCPAFDHRYKIENFQIKNSRSLTNEDLFVRLVERMRGQVSQLRFAPTVLPGGLSLKADYFVDIALYSTSTKNRYSNWHRSEGKLNINKESRVNVQSCIGVKEENNPLPESRIPNIRDLEIR